MNISKTFQGAIVIGDIVNGRHFERQYIGYSLKDAKRIFRQDVKKERSKSLMERLYP